jgi:hypothetical protein
MTDDDTTYYYEVRPLWPSPVLVSEYEWSPEILRTDGGGGTNLARLVTAWSSLSGVLLLAVVKGKKPLVVRGKASRRNVI